MRLLVVSSSHPLICPFPNDAFKHWIFFIASSTFSLKIGSYFRNHNDKEAIAYWIKTTNDCALNDLYCYR